MGLQGHLFEHWVRSIFCKSKSATVHLAKRQIYRLYHVYFFHFFSPASGILESETQTCMPEASIGSFGARTQKSHGAEIFRDYEGMIL